MIGTTLGQQGFELLEDGLDEVRWECGHGFSPSSGSLEDSPDDRASRVRFPSSGPSHLSAQALSLRFNYEGFCEGLYSIAKPFAFAQFVASGGRFDGRVALGPAGEPPSGSPRRPTPQGFGAFAGVPICAKSDETTRCTRTGVRRPAS